MKTLSTYLGAALLAASVGVHAHDHNDEDRDGAADVEAAPEYQHRANQLIGADVVNRDDQTIGDIDDLLLDDEGKATHAVLSVGGFLGVGDQLVAVPFEELDIAGTPDDPEVLYDATEEELEDQPEFEYREEAEDRRDNGGNGLGS